MARARSINTARWPLLGLLAWIAVVAALAQLLLALTWPDGLRSCSRATLHVHYASFMARTFTYHAGIAMLPVMALALLSRRRRLLMAAAAVLLLGAGPEIITARPRINRAGAADGSLKIMSVNLMYGDGDNAALLAHIAREAPDVIVLQEWTEDGARRLRAGLGAAYPHAFESARSDAFGQAVFSKVAFEEAPRLYPPVPGFQQPQIGVAVRLGGRVLRIDNVHLLPPTGLTYFNEQRLTAAALALWVSDTSRTDAPDVLIGDFNATNRTATVGAMLGAGFRDAQREAGWWRGSTWPRVGSLRWCPGVQLDHALCGPRVRCVRARTGEDFGSDHRPVIVQVKWRDAAGD